MVLKRSLLLAALALFACAAASAAPVHPWEKQELILTAAHTYANPYTEVTVWVDLTGPHFHKRVYGFWDGGATFHVRVVATEPGTWRWSSGSKPADPGLDGKTGSFTAVPWTDADMRANPLRHGFLRATANQHALQYADGTPYFALGDTWWALGTNRFRWYDDDRERPLGPQAGFKDYIRYRKSQGFNWVNMLAAFPNWMTDGKPWHVVMDDPAHTTVRSAWLEFGTGSAKNMDNEGGRPFLFPGKVPGYENMFPDVDRINPAYFDYIDRKVDYLNAQGFIVFIEPSRRDASMLWSKYYRWPDSYARFIEYIWSRYQANNVVLSPIHLDIIAETVGPDEYLKAIAMVKEKYGMPPFGTLLSANASPSTLENWGDDSWVTLHQIGNHREHDNYWYLTEIFRAPHTHPALDGEPYYAGYDDARTKGAGNGYKYGAKGGTERDDQFVRSAMYGTFLSGGFGGYVYGAEGIWGADIEQAAPVHMWDAFQWNSASQVKYLRDFAFSIGKRYQDLEPNADLVSPNKTPVVRGYEGWAYCARTPDRKIFLVYFEKGCPRSQVRGARLNSDYRAEWFDPRKGEWLPAGVLHSSPIGILTVPGFPSDTDWGLRLTLQEKTGSADRAAEVQPDPNRGLYAIWTGRDTQLLELPFIRGGQVMAQWADVEPAEGRYDFGAVDRQFEALGSRMATVQINANQHPAWLFEKVPSTQKKLSNQVRDARGTLAYWHPAYVKAYLALLRAYGQHVKSAPYRQRVLGVRLNFNALGTEHTAVPEADRAPSAWHVPPGVAPPAEWTPATVPAYQHTVVDAFIREFTPQIRVFVRNNLFAGDAADPAWVRMLESGGLSLFHTSSEIEPRAHGEGQYRAFLKYCRTGDTVCYAESWADAEGHHGGLTDPRWCPPAQYNYWRLLCDLNCGVSFIAVYGDDLRHAREPEFRDAFDFAKLYAGYHASPQSAPGAWVALREGHTLKGDYSFLMRRLPGAVMEPLEEAGPKDQRFGAWARRLPKGATARFALDPDFARSLGDHPVTVKITYLDEGQGQIRIHTGATEETVSMANSCRWQTASFHKPVSPEITISADANLTLHMLEVRR